MAKATTTQILTTIKEWVLGRIAEIAAVIPSQASSTNQLADKAFVNSSIATATATFRGTYNLVSDLSLTTSATQQQIAAALATKMTALSITPDANDYAFVQIPAADATPTVIARVDRYKFNGSAWAYEYSLNNSGFTAEQWAAINSGLTSGDMTKLRALPTSAELTTLLNGKQDTIQDLATIRSGASDGATAVQPAALSAALVQTVAESGVFDLSAHNAVNGVLATYADLSAALTALNALSSEYKKPGMSFKFIHTSDKNKYVQYRCIADEFTIDETKWVGEEIKVKNSNVDFAISDENHNDIVQFANGHIKTKNFDSSQKATDSLDGLMSKEDKQKLNGIEEGAEVNNIPIDNIGTGDLEFSDEDGNILVRFKNGHIKTKNFDSKDIEERVSDLEGKTSNNKILTIGDSLTEGSGANQNYKGETLTSYYTYTSWMQTKTTHYVFSRHGIGGENSAAILGRMYGAPLVVGEKFTLPANTSPVQINLVSSWYDKENDGRRNQNLGGAGGTVRDTNPCTINGIPVTLSLSSGTYYIQRNTAASESVDILADTPIIPTNYTTYKDSTYGLVFWCGTNDGTSAEFTDELIEHIRKTAEKYNTDRYVVVGIHQITAEKTLAMRQRQEVQLQDAFGDRFINWREYASNFAIRDAIARGYIEDSGTYPTAADITAMSEGKVPPTLLVDTVHLCEEGYMLVGDLIFERLVSLGYINNEL